VLPAGGEGWVRRRGNGKYIGVSRKRMRYFTPTQICQLFDVSAKMGLMGLYATLSIDDT
jgi:hypothetical protein